jgi:hypothetical protein
MEGVVALSEASRVIRAFLFAYSLPPVLCVRVYDNQVPQAVKHRATSQSHHRAMPQSITSESHVAIKNPYLIRVNADITLALGRPFPSRVNHREV